MATKTTSTKKPATPKKAKPKVESTPEVMPVVEPVVKKAPKKKRPDDHDQITVVSGCPTPLGFVSKRNPYATAFWREIGFEQRLEFRDLMEMAAEQPKFFIKNWIFVDPEILAYLRMDKYYQNALSAEEYEHLFERPINEIIEIIKKLPDGQKTSLAYRAKSLADEGKLDSVVLRKFLEDLLGISLFDD